MQNRRILLLLIAGLAAPLLGADKPGKAAPSQVVWLTDLDKAIEQIQETGRLLLVDNGWQREGT